MRRGENDSLMDKAKCCNWLDCAHGMGVAGTDGSCYMRGSDVNDKNCPEFIIHDDYERQARERHEKNKGE